MITSEEIKRRLWDGANELRGSMDASRYKDYMLGLMFYKFLSDKTLEAFRQALKLGSITENELIAQYTEVANEFPEKVFNMIKNLLGYVVPPQYLYQKWLRDIDNGEFEVQNVTDSLNNFERNIATSSDSNDFRGLFSSSTLDLSDTALGNNLNERNKNIQALILLFADLNMVSLQKDDILGDAYEYLIGMFAMESGKKAGEFYTPRQVSEVMAQIVAKSGKISSIYDAAVGSGSLLLTVGKHLSNDDQRNLNYYGQEKNTATYNLTRMNLLLHGVRPERMTIRNDDTLGQDWPEDPKKPNQGVLFDAVVMNPPYSLKNWNRHDIRVNDPRFESFGVLPPSSKGDYAFLLHGLYHLDTNGTMAIVLPHGVLFRGGTEGTIRTRLIDKNNIDTVIGLPSNLFTNTGIPVVVIILKKNRALDEPVLFIDSSKNFIKVGKQNQLQEKDIAKIVDTYINRTEKEGYSHLASREEIIENEYNLNIPRYVNSFDDEIPHDVDAHLYGGIPEENIKDLEVLQAIGHNVLKDSFTRIRPGYYELIGSVDDLKKNILNEDSVVIKTKELEEKVNTYINKYWEKLRIIDSSTNVSDLMNEMQDEIKKTLEDFNYLNIYDGYQVIADLWKDSLLNDVQLISVSDFYTIARSREPNMIWKGSGKNRQKVQDGWVGSIVDNQLIEKHLFTDVTNEINELKNEISEIDSRLLELAEEAKIEETDENLALFDSLKMAENEEPTDDFDLKLIRSALKVVEKDTNEEKLLKEVDQLFVRKSDINKTIKSETIQLEKDVQDRILTLTDQEIDQLVFEKWFGKLSESLTNLIKTPIYKELEVIKLLNDRYSETIDDIDSEIEKLEKELESMMADLVVTND